MSFDRPQDDDERERSFTTQRRPSRLGAPIVVSEASALGVLSVLSGTVYSTPLPRPLYRVYTVCRTAR